MNDTPKTLTDLRLTTGAARFIEANVATATGGFGRVVALVVMAIIAMVVLALWLAAGGALLSSLSGDQGEALRAAFLLIVSLPLAIGLAMAIAFQARLGR